MKRHPKPVILALVALLPVGLVAAAAFVTVAVPSQATPAAAAAPGNAGGPHGKAVAIEPIKDVGSVAKGDKVTQDFEIRNDGTVPLKIVDVKPACGCTVASFDKTIAPGKTGKVHVVVDTVSFNGPISKGVTVYTDDPTNAEIDLTVRVKVEPFIVVQPGYARYVTVRGESKEGTIVQTLWAPDGLPMDVVKVDSPFPYLTVSFREAQEGERVKDVKVKQWRVESLLSNEAPVGPLAGMVVVHTTHPKQKEVDIPITGFVRPIIAVTPPKGDFGQIEVKEPLRRVLEVKTFSTEPIKLLGIDPVGKGIEAKLEPVEEGRRYEVRLTLNPDMPKGPFHDKLTIHTDSAKSPVVEVELSGTVL
jgi:Protein of unknown function (DUF1573)